MSKTNINYLIKIKNFLLNRCDEKSSSNLVDWNVSGRSLEETIPFSLEMTSISGKSVNKLQSAFLIKITKKDEGY